MKNNYMDILENPVTVTEEKQAKPKLNGTAVTLEITDRADFARVLYALEAVMTKGIAPNADVTSVCAVYGTQTWSLGWCAFEDTHMLKRLASAAGSSMRVFIRNGDAPPKEIRDADIDCGTFTFA